MNKAIRSCKGKLYAAFRELRKDGIDARANFMCCSSCAVAALDKSDGNGGVYWHAQANDFFNERGYVHIGFVGDCDHEQRGVALRLVSTLKDYGLDVEWDGDLGSKVVVYAAGARVREA